MHVSQWRDMYFRSFENIPHFADIYSCDDVDSCDEVVIRVNGGLVDNGFLNTPQVEMQAR